MSTLLLLLTLLRSVYVYVEIDVVTPQLRVCDVVADVDLPSLPIGSVRHSTSLLLDFFTTHKRLASVVLSHDSFYDRVLAGFG